MDVVMMQGMAQEDGVAKTSNRVSCVATAMTVPVVFAKDGSRYTDFHWWMRVNNVAVMQSRLERWLLKVFFEIVATVDSATAERLVQPVCNKAGSSWVKPFHETLIAAVIVLVSGTPRLVFGEEPPPGFVAAPFLVGVPATPGVKFRMAPRSPMVNEPVVDIVFGQDKEVCKAYEGFINYAGNAIDFSNPDYDDVPFAPGFQQFSVPYWEMYVSGGPGFSLAQESAQRLIDEYVVAHDVNLAFFDRNKGSTYTWKATSKRISNAKQQYFRFLQNNGDPNNLKRAVVDINNDGRVDHIWRRDAAGFRTGSLVVTDEYGTAIDTMLTALLRRHPGRDELGSGYFVKVPPEDRDQLYYMPSVQKMGVAIGADAFHDLHYHVFGFGGANYFSLQWRHGLNVKLVVGNQYNKVIVFRADGEKVQTVCDMKFLNWK